jgi:hypothetical protein
MADLVLLCDLEVQSAGNGEPTVRRVIRTKPSRYYEAGDRTGRLPETLDLHFPGFLAAFNAATASDSTEVVDTSAAVDTTVQAVSKESPQQKEKSNVE